MMTLKALRRALAAEAKDKGICPDWHRLILNAPNKERLLTLLIMGLDFALTKDFPSLELAQEFQDVGPASGVYIDQTIHAEGKKHVIALGESRGEAIYKGYDVAEVYVTGNSHLRIQATENAAICVTVCTGASVAVHASGSARVFIISHGGEIDCADAQKNANVKTIISTQQWPEI